MNLPAKQIVELTKICYQVILYQNTISGFQAVDNFLIDKLHK